MTIHKKYAKEVSATAGKGKKATSKGRFEELVNSTQVSEYWKGA